MGSEYMLGFLLVVCYFFLLLSAHYEESDAECPAPASFACGYLGDDIHFPFTNTANPQCGLAITGCDNPDAEKKILLSPEDKKGYIIQSIIPLDNYNLISIRHESLCSPLSNSVHDITIDVHNPIVSLHTLGKLSPMIFHRCDHNNDNSISPGNPPGIQCPQYDIYSKPPDECSSVPCLISSELLIEVKLSKRCYECYFERKGLCLLDENAIRCVNETKKGHSKAKIIGLSIGLAGVAIIALIVIGLLYKRRYNSSGYQNQPRNIDSVPSSNINTASGAVYFGIPVFSYEELQEATNNFDQARELGEGGFGIVYYGKLRDGREVAVKRLYERNYKPVESFTNEIFILTRLRHRNLVTLYGCTSRHSRELLLVYEYIPNGTVAYHLHDDKPKPGLLPWPVRMKIAIETARALAYLHASDIVHRDVKTSNILLDNNFCVKVADFGLSRLFPADVTHVSTAPRGTPGYVDPDYRLCYQLTSKSDVYSFGVVLVELISSLPAVDLGRERDSITLANLALRKIHRREFYELVDPSLGFQSDDKIKRMITSVAELAFRCLQGDKDSRPSMGEVLEVLQRIESRNDEPWNQEGIDACGARVSHSYAHPPLPNTLIKPQLLRQTV